MSGCAVVTCEGGMDCVALQPAKADRQTAASMAQRFSSPSRGEGEGRGGGWVGVGD
jgi:hypothetical protein